MTEKIDIKVEVELAGEDYKYFKKELTKWLAEEGLRLTDDSPETLKRIAEELLKDTAYDLVQAMEAYRQTEDGLSIEDMLEDVIEEEGLIEHIDEEED